MTKKFIIAFDEYSGKESAECAKCGSHLVEIKVQSNQENDGVNDFLEVVSTYTCKSCGTAYSCVS